MRLLPLFAILLISGLLRVPAFFQPVWYLDEGMFASIAGIWLEGGALYTDAWDNKTPGIFAVYALGWSTGLEMFAVRLLDLAAMLAVIVLIYAMARQLAGDVSALVAAAVAGVLLGLPTIEGHIANTESFLIVFSTLGMYLVLQSLDIPGHGASRRRYALLVLAGLALGAACLFKQVAAFDVIAVVVFLAMVYRTACLRPLVSFGAGLAVLPLVVALLFVAFGSFGDLWFATVESLVGYREYSDDTGFERYLVAAMPIVIALPYALRLRPWRTRAPEALFVLWLAFIALAISASGRAYPHYLIQMVPPFALVAAMAASANRPRLPRASVGLGLVTVCLVLIHVMLGPLPNMAWYEPGFTRAYYANFAHYALGDIERESHDAFFGSRAHTHLGLYEELEEAGLRSEEVFVWGDVPWLYAEAGLDNPTPYVTLFSAYEVEGGLLEIAFYLTEVDPDYVLVMEESRSSWEEAPPELAGRYSLAREMQGALLYERR